MNQSDQPRPSLWDSLNRMLDVFLATAENRAQLFAVECQEEKCRNVEAILLAISVAALGALGITLATVTIIVFFWDRARLVTLVTLSGLYVLGALATWRVLKARLKNQSPFSTTIDQLEKDRSCLHTEN